RRVQGKAERLPALRSAWAGIDDLRSRSTHRACHSGCEVVSTRRARARGPLRPARRRPVAAAARRGRRCCRCTPRGQTVTLVAVYLDSSVVLRAVLGQPDRLPEWESIDEGIASALLEVECLRTLDRLRIANPKIGDEALAVRRATVFRIVEALQIVDVSLP